MTGKGAYAEHWLARFELALAAKFNPYHGPDGRFTTAQGAGRAGSAPESTGRPVRSTKELSSGVNRSVIVTFDDGTEGLWKPEHGASGYHDGNSEVAAYQISELLGAGTPRTEFMEIAGEMGTVQDWVNADPGISQGLGKPRQLPDNADAIVALDVVIYNPDRHGSNWLVDSRNRGYAIDNGHASWELWETSNKSPAWRSHLLGKQDQGQYIFSKQNIATWSKITRGQFMACFENVKTKATEPGHNVDPENAWRNLQFVVAQGRIIW